MKKEETRGRKPKIHKPINASFGQVLGAIAKSAYKPESVIKKKEK